MAITPVAITVAGGSGSGVTTSGIDTTGANLLVVSTSRFSGSGAPTLSDSKGNTWTALTEQVSGNVAVRLYYCAGTPTVGAGHTVTFSGSSVFPGAWFGSFASAVASPFDQESGTSGGSGTLQPGSITPSADGSLLVCGNGWENGSSPSIDGGFTDDALDYSPGSYVGIAGAYLIQTSAAAANPTRTVTGSSSLQAAMASFLAATGGGGVTENATPVVATASVVAVASSLSQALAPVAATASVVAPAQALAHGFGAVSCTASVVGVTASLGNTPDAVVATAGVVAPATSLSQALSATSCTASVVAPATELSQAATPVVATGTVPAVTAAAGTIESPSPVTCSASVVAAETALSQALAACLATATVVAVSASVPGATGAAVWASASGSSRVAATAGGTSRVAAQPGGRSSSG